MPLSRRARCQDVLFMHVIGPGGEGAAMKLIKAGCRVAVVERHQEVGGGATHWGTMPSCLFQRLHLRFRRLYAGPGAR
jgi:pyruvate/2-oxoglutarate dehydrogenase complex dihydrolipoamide dehydrogenase (E3) component